MLYPKSLQCPVCRESLGYLTKGEVCSFVCKECKWIYTWDTKGKLLQPVKLESNKPKKCICPACIERDSH